MAAAAASSSSTEKRKVCHNAVMADTQLQTLYFIPNDIIVEILSWLQADSLLRFRWACKYWFDLITRDHDFVKLHLHRSISIHDPYVWCSHPPKDLTTKCFQIRTPVASKIFVDFRVLGSCHGLLFFSYKPSTDFACQEETIYCIWNPCTKEYKNLPNPKPFYFRRRGIHTFGFGYDPSIDDYKVIRNIFSYNKIDECVSCRHVLVYTLRTNSWKTSTGSIFGNSLPCDGRNAVFVNGTLYWIERSKTKILSFDIEKETYKEISDQPECLLDGSKVLVKLDMFEGFLCLLLYTDSQSNLEVWMMKDYTANNNNKNSSWIKLFNISRGFSGVGYNKNLNPLRLAKNGETPLFDRAKRCMLEWGEKTKAVYIRSLVSVNSGTYNVEEQQCTTL